MNLKQPLALLTASMLMALTGCADSADPQADSSAPAGDHNTTGDTPDTHTEPHDMPTPAALDFEMPALDGSPVNLADYHGQVVLIVNTASECGLTPQYEKLQQLYEQYADDGLTVLGFPANNFNAQEPGTNDEIAAFCEANYGVTFPMFAKLSVKGDDQHPFYAYLTGEATNPDHAGEVTWNFEKFLISREGEVVARFAPRTTPDDPAVVAAIEAELAKTQTP